MSEEVKFKKTPMQELKSILYQTKEMLSKDEKYSDFDFRIQLEVVVSLLDNAFEIEASSLSNAFDYGFLQAELKERAEVTNGREYVCKYYKQDEDISSKVQSR